MKKDTYIKLLAIAGIIFAGYLITQWYKGVCNGGCSLLFGQPTCLYGLFLFSTILVASLAKRRNLVAAIAGFGILFSAYFVVQEFLVCITCYQFGFPNCFYGMLVYLIILLLAWPKKKSKEEKQQRKVVSKNAKRKKKQ